jgi:uncharacterized protein YgiM (DUF1202 family)
MGKDRFGGRMNNKRTDLLIKGGISMRRKTLVAAVMVAILMMSAALPALADLPGVETGEVVSQNVTLRVGHTSGSTTVRSLHNGETFEILDRWEDWLYIAYFDTDTAQTINGWLLDYYVVENPIHITLRNSNTAAYAYPSSDSKRVGSISKYTRLTVIAQLDRFWVVSLREAAAAIPKTAKVWLDEDLEAWTSIVPTTGSVTRRTTARTGPGTNWTSVKTLNAGATVDILGSEGDWYVIKYEEAIAYIKMADSTY